MLYPIFFRAIVTVILACAAAFFRPAAMQPAEAIAFGLGAAAAAVFLDTRIRKLSVKRLIGIAAGVLLGLVCSALLSAAIGHVGFAAMLCAIVLTYLGAAAGAAKGDLLNLGDAFGVENGPRGNHKILDTSVIIDGRIADIADTGFLDGVLVIPQFVLHELQMVADSADSMKRNRGRRGLDVLQRIQKMSHLKVEVVQKDFPEVREVDMKLIELAQLYNCRIVTNDFNLNKVAHVRGVGVLNINELANSVKPIVLPGELMRVFILKEGKEYNQGVAYLDDGTMVVVDNARRMISKTIDISVTSVLQTTAGKMIFGKYDERLQPAVPSLERAERPPRREQAVGEN